MTNTEPLVIPFGGADPALGTNPIAFAAPARTAVFDLDLATSQVAINRIYNARDEGRRSPRLGRRRARPADHRRRGRRVGSPTRRLQGLRARRDGRGPVRRAGGRRRPTRGRRALRRWQEPQNVGHFHLALDPERTVGRDRSRTCSAGCWRAACDPGRSGLSTRCSLPAIPRRARGPRASARACRSSRRCGRACTSSAPSSRCRARLVTCAEKRRKPEGLCLLRRKLDMVGAKAFSTRGRPSRRPRVRRGPASRTGTDNRTRAASRGLPDLVATGAPHAARPWQQRPSTPSSSQPGGLLLAVGAMGISSSGSRSRSRCSQRSARPASWRCDWPSPRRCCGRLTRPAVRGRDRVDLCAVLARALLGRADAGLLRGDRPIRSVLR